MKYNMSTIGWKFIALYDYRENKPEGISYNSLMMNLEVLPWNRTEN